MKSILLTLSLLVSGLVAHADVTTSTGPAWTCQLTGNLSGFSASPIISFQHLSGTGTLSCDTVDNHHMDVPVSMTLSGLGVGLGFSNIQNVSVYSASIGIADDPHALMGSYGVGATAGATLIQAGISFDVALNLKKEGGASFDIGLKSMDAQGLELKLQGMVFEISTKQ